MFDDEFIAQLPEDKTTAIIILCKKLFTFHRSVKYPLRHYKRYIEALGFLEAYSEAKGESIDFPGVGMDREENVRNVISLFKKTSEVYEKRLQQEMLERMKKEYTQKLTTETFLYNFKDSDTLNIKKKIIDLRALISKKKFLDKGYKLRLIKRLDRLQNISYKTLPDLDMFWGVILESSVLYAMLGNEWKPVIDSMKELAQAVWQVQLRAEGLPESTPFLPFV